MNTMRSLFAVCFVLFISTSEAGTPNCGPSLFCTAGPSACGLLSGTYYCKTGGAGLTTPTANTGKRGDLEARTTPAPVPTSNLLCRLVGNSTFSSCDNNCQWSYNVTVSSTGQVCVVTSDCASSGPTTFTCSRTAPRISETEVCQTVLTPWRKWGAAGSYTGTVTSPEDGYTYSATGHTVDAASDGNPSTWYYGSSSSTCYAAFDFGTSVTVTGVNYIIRPTHATYWNYRYQNHLLQGSDSEDFGVGGGSGYTTIGDTGSGPTADSPGYNGFNIYPQYATSRFRYYRVVGNYGCNWAELVFIGCCQDSATWTTGAISKGTQTGFCFNTACSLVDTDPCSNHTTTYVGGVVTPPDSGSSNRRRFNDAGSPVQIMFGNKGVIRRDVI